MGHYCMPQAKLPAFGRIEAAGAFEHKDNIFFIYYYINYSQT